jgi:hypothetical protein
LKKIVFVCIAVLLAGTAWSEDNPNYRNLSVYFENDLVSRTDYEYTNGFLLQYVSNDIETLDLPKWCLAIKDKLSMFDHEGYRHNIGIGFGQDMFTPRDLEDQNLIEDDRPYAGWTYIALSLNHKDATKLHKFELKLGIVGESAFAEEVQELVHTFTRSTESRGWDHQLKDEPGINLAYEYRKRYIFLNNWVDVIPKGRIDVGNVSTGALTGATLRYGYNLPNDFHSNRISSAGAVYPTNYKSKGLFSLYVFTTVTGYVIVRDIFLDGNTFKNSHSVDKKYYKGEIEFGAGISYKRVYFTYTQIYVTKTYDTQKSSHSYGSFNLGVRY